MLADEERAAILALPGQSEEVDVRYDFVRLGQKIDHACLIVTGLAARFGETLDGKRQIVAIHLPGDMADLHSVVAPKVSWALQALTRSTILKIPHRALLELVTRYPAVGVAFWRDGVVDASIMAQWMLNYGRKLALANVSHLLCEMFIRYRQIDNTRGQTFEFPVTQNQIADVLGLTPIHVNRMLAALKRDGIATKIGKMVTINDWDGLKTAAEFDPIYLQITDAPKAIPVLD